MAGWLVGQPGGQPAAGGIEINTNSAHQLGLNWDLAGLSLATRTENQKPILEVEVCQPKNINQKHNISELIFKIRERSF